MLSTTLFFLLLCSPTMNLALNLGIPPQPTLRTRRLWQRTSSSSRKVPAAGYYPPLDAGGSMLTQVPGTFPEGQGEPINVIISGNSDSRVLVDAEMDGGLQNYYLSFGFGGECLGQHSGSDQAANLGDGNGYKNETGVIRWDYGDPQLGTCTETIQGGNHFRYWVQDGPDGNSGAIFMAVSYELPIAQQHDIVSNGYNNGRDWLIGNITSVPVGIATNTTTLNGQTAFGGYIYQTNIQYISGMLPNTSDGINHNVTVQTNTTNAVDGLVVVLDVKITEAPASSTSSASISAPHLSWLLVALLPLFALS